MSHQHAGRSGGSGSSKQDEPPIEVDWSVIGDVDRTSLSDMARACLSSPCKTGSEPSKTWGEHLVEKLLNQALSGELRALLEIWTRLEGKPGVAERKTSPPITIDDELARMILRYGREEADGEPDH